jgi:transposase InsO family protein
MSMAGSDALMRLLDATLVAYVTHGASVFEPSGIAAWCRTNKISRATLYRHLARIQQEGSWRPHSRAPRRRPGATPQVVVEAILKLRSSLAPENGPITIHYHLGQRAELAGHRLPCPATIHRILRRHGLVAPAPKKRPKSSWRRFAYARPRDCYQIDATTVTLAGGAKVVVFEVLDDCTRTLVATRAALRETSTDAIAAMSTAFTTFGVPAIVLSDNGLAFAPRTAGSISRFARLITDHGARLIHSSPYHPQTCGKVERHHRTFKDWLALQPCPATLVDLQARCETYQQWYNTTRPHSALKRPPLQAWNTAVEHGSPQHLPVQQDATVKNTKVSHVGVIRTGQHTLSVGQHRAGQVMTVIRDGDHVTVYDPNGKPLGHLLIDHTRAHQGQLTAA